MDQDLANLVKNSIPSDYYCIESIKATKENEYEEELLDCRI